MDKKEKAKERSRLWYLKNKEKALERHKKRYGVYFQNDTVYTVCILCT